MNDVLSKVRRLNWLLQESPTGALSFNEMCREISVMLDANVYVCNARGKVIGISATTLQDVSIARGDESGILLFPEEYNDVLMRVSETKANLSFEDIKNQFGYECVVKDRFRTIIPIVGGGNRWGTLIMTRVEPVFSNEDLVLGETGATIVGLEIQRQKTVEKEEQKRLESVVQLAIGTLSYSEHEAVQHILNELDGDEDLLIASKIADRSGITRSVIVNALRKLESAGIIESRSLGMKGTRIKVLNPYFKTKLMEQAR